MNECMNHFAKICSFEHIAKCSFDNYSMINYFYYYHMGNDEIIERIKLLSSKFNTKSMGELADVLKIARPNFSQILQKKRPLGESVLNKICVQANINKDWLLYGTGERDQVISNSTIVGVYSTSELAQVPFVSIAATASFIETCCDETVIAETMGVVGYTQEEVNKNGYIVVEVNGCSMEPTIMDRARILGKRVDPADWEYISKGIYIVGYGRDMLVIKRIKGNDLLEKGTLTLYSDNVEYGELTIPKSAIRCIWKGLEIVKQKLL